MSFEEHNPNERLRRARHLKGWTQSQLAERVGTNFETVSRWECGISIPSAYCQQKLCHVLDTTPQELGLIADLTEPLTASTSPAVFLAAAYVDAEREFLTRLKVHLQARGVTVLSSRSLRRQGGENQRKALQEAIRTAQAVLLIASPEACSSRHVQKALKMARIYKSQICAIWIDGLYWPECVSKDGGAFFATIDARKHNDDRLFDKIVTTLEEVWLASNETVVPVTTTHQTAQAPPPYPNSAAIPQQPSNSGITPSYPSSPRISNPTGTGLSRPAFHANGGRVPTGGVPMSSETSPDGGFALHIHLLGGFHVLQGSRTIGEGAWRLQRARTLVKVLALAPEHQLHCEQVLELLWPDAELKDASNSLHQVLHAARYALGQATQTDSSYLQLQGEMLLLASQQPVWIDVEVFEAAAAHARRSQDPAAYRMGLALYTGDLLPEDRYEDWTNLRRDLLRRIYLGLILDLARLLESQQVYAEASTLLESLLRLDPTCEEAHAALMRLLALTDHPQIALSQYQTLKHILQQELDTTPQLTTECLFQDILAGRFPPACDDSVSPVMSSSRLGKAGWPMSPATDREAQATNLPVQANSFIGRSREVADVRDLLERSRLLTITGVGGSGKTRLALQIAERLLEHFPDGVWLIEFASLRQSSLVPGAVAQVLELPEQPGRPLTETLIARLALQQVLLVLDNCEHLIDSCATLAKVLVQACPRMCLLCTSREPLHIPGEVIWRLSSLSLPDVHQVSKRNEISRSESVQLFVDRARAVVPGFSLTERNALAVGQICCRLDGLPLPLELAAARVSVLSAEQIAERLDNCFSLLTTGSRTALTRQQTLKATLDWSYHLLSDPERVLFRRLAVFAGGCDLDTVSAVSALESGEAGGALDLVASLVDKSLVVAEERADQMRYHLLEPVRQYAEYWLEHSGETKQVRRRHRDWFQARVEQANSAMGGMLHSFWVAYLEREHDNLRAALGWCLREGSEAMAALPLGCALWQFWLLRGYLVEGRRWLESCLEKAPAPTALRAETLLYAYALSIRQAEYAAATGRSMIEQSLSIYRDLNDIHGVNRALQMYGIQAYMAGDYRRARNAFGESRVLAQNAGQVADCALAIYSLGVVEHAQGNFPLARQHMEESLALLQGLDKQPGICFALINLATMELPFGAAGQVLMVDEETWVLLRALSTSAVVGYILANLGNLARLEDAPGRAHTRLKESKALFERLGDKAGLGQVLGQIGNLCRSERNYDQARTFLEQSLALRQELGDQRGIGRTLNNLGVLAMAEGAYQQAHALFEQSMAHFAAMGDTVGIGDTFDKQGHLALFEGEYRRARVLYTESLSTESFATSYKQGDPNREAAAPQMLMHLGIAAWAAGDHAEASTSLEASLTLSIQMGNQRGIARLRHLLANFDQGHPISEEPAAPSA